MSRQRTTRMARSSVRLARKLAGPARQGGAAHPILALQRSVGNRGVSRAVQTKLRVGKQAPTASPRLESRIGAARGRGQPMSKGSRRFFESRFGSDFSPVRLHTDSEAASVARDLRARAFTVGNDIFFGRGSFEPASRASRSLLAHELTHVVQQTGSSGTGASARIATERSGPRIQRDTPPKKGGTKKKATGPCGRPALAPTFVPTDRAIKTVSVSGFGETSRLAAYFTPRACLKSTNWSFFLESLEVNVKSAVQPATFTAGRRTYQDVDGPGSSLITKSTIGTMIRELTPNRTIKLEPSCSGVKYPQTVIDIPRRREYWSRSITIAHEAFHRKDWEKIYRKHLVSAEKAIHGLSLAKSSASTEAKAVAAKRSDITTKMVTAYKDATAEYCADKEVDAYANDKAAYTKLVSEIEARGKKAGWIP